MTGPSVEEIFSDVVIIGSGVAGLTTALGSWPLSTTILTKSGLGKGGASCWAQGGIAAALGKDDCPQLHARDTLAVGLELSDPEIVEMLTNEGPLQIQKLMELGAAFDHKENGEIFLGREAAHSRRRIVHAHGDSTGAEMVRTLVKAVHDSSRVKVVEDVFASDLLLENGRVTGVLSCRKEKVWSVHRGRAVILATGGVGQLFSRTTNPPECTADGLAMAARAGARLTDLEFVQFHPTALSAGISPMPLLTEALRGEGAILIDENGQRFMYIPKVNWRPEILLLEKSGKERDVVSQFFWTRVKQSVPCFPNAFLQYLDTVVDTGLIHVANQFQLVRQLIITLVESLLIAMAALLCRDFGLVERWQQRELMGLID